MMLPQRLLPTIFRNDELTSKPIFKTERISYTVNNGWGGACSDWATKPQTVDFWPVLLKFDQPKVICSFDSRVDNLNQTRWRRIMGSTGGAWGVHHASPERLALPSSSGRWCDNLPDGLHADALRSSENLPTGDKLATLTWNLSLQKNFEVALRQLTWY